MADAITNQNRKITCANQNKHWTWTSANQCPTQAKNNTSNKISTNTFIFGCGIMNLLTVKRFYFIAFNKLDNNNTLNLMQNQ